MVNVGKYTSPMDPMGYVKLNKTPTCGNNIEVTNLRTSKGDLYRIDPLDRVFKIWVFPKIGVPQNGLFIMENLVKMDDLGGTPIFGNTHLLCHISYSKKTWKLGYMFCNPMAFEQKKSTQTFFHE